MVCRSPDIASSASPPYCVLLPSAEYWSTIEILVADKNNCKSIGGKTITSLRRGDTTMSLRVVTAAVLMLAWTMGGVRAECTMRGAGNMSCIVDVVCYGEFRLSDYRPPLCPSIAKTHVRLNLRGASPSLVTSCESHFKRVLWLRASKNHWRELPVSVLKCTTNLHYLVASGNKIYQLRDDSLSNLTELRHADLSNNNISHISKQYFSANKKLERLYLAHNAINTISDGTFLAQSSLEHLDLSHNELLKLRLNTFNGLKSLKVLMLNNNLLFILNGALKNLHALQQLYLQQNKLHNFDIKEIPHISKLHTIDMTNNSLSYIHPEVLSNIPGVEVAARLRISGSPKKELPSERTAKILLAKNKIAELGNASFDASSSNLVTRSTHKNDVVVETSAVDTMPTEIDLSSNIIEKIEYDAFSGISLLISLDLSNNKLVHFVVNTTNLSKLEKLHLQNNDLIGIDAITFRFLRNLKIFNIGANKVEFMVNNSYWSPGGLELLNLSHNKLKELTGAALGPLDHLRELSATDNSLSTVILNGEKHLTGLRVLSLRSNDIEDLRAVRLCLLELQTLDLSENSITEVSRETFRKTSALRRLDLSKNEIATLESGSFDQLGRLLFLNLANNNLTAIEYGSLTGLVHLQRLDLSRNRLSALDSRVLFDLHALEEIRLDDNELSSVDTSVWAGRSGSVLLSLGGNKLSCSWVERGLEDARQGWSVARLTTRVRRGAVSVAGIDCDQRVGVVSSASTDDRLLYVSQNILQAILRQTQELKKVLKMVAYPKNIQNKTQS